MRERLNHKQKMKPVVKSTLARWTARGSLRLPVGGLVRYPLLSGSGPTIHPGGTNSTLLTQARRAGRWRRRGRLKRGFLARCRSGSFRRLEYVRAHPDFGIPNVRAGTTHPPWSCRRPRTGCIVGWMADRVPWRCEPLRRSLSRESSRFGKTKRPERLSADQSHRQRLTHRHGSEPCHTSRAVYRSPRGGKIGRCLLLS